MHNEAPKRRLPILIAPILILTLAACAPGAGGPGWTFAPVGPTPEPAQPTPTNGEPVGTVIEVQMQNFRFLQDGQELSQLTLTIGEDYTFRVENLDGFAHDMYFGPPEQLAAWDESGLPGHPEWETGVQEFSYTPSAEHQGWQFACTVQGHYQAGMLGELVLEGGE